MKTTITIDLLLRCLEQCQQEAGGIMPDWLPALKSVSVSFAEKPSVLLRKGFDRAYRLLVEGV